MNDNASSHDFYDFYSALADTRIGGRNFKFFRRLFVLMWELVQK